VQDGSGRMNGIADRHFPGLPVLNSEVDNIFRKRQNRLDQLPRPGSGWSLRLSSKSRTNSSKINNFSQHMQSYKYNPTRPLIPSKEEAGMEDES
jgi:hypothetical protein